VPEDRFADLGPGDPDKRSAAERFAELDETDPEPQPKPPAPPRPSGRYTWVLGIAFIIVVIVAGANALRHTGAGFRGVPPGKALAPFAAPLATSNHDNDVNVQRTESHGVPAACDVHLPGVVNLCDLRRRPLVITFVATGGSGCGDQLDRVEPVARRYTGVTFLGVISRTSLSEARTMVRSHRWSFPVALDRDAQLFNLYGIGDCPTTVFARKGGLSAGSRRGKLSRTRLENLVSATVEGRRLDDRD
jgi:hypothetical protein